MPTYLPPAMEYRFAEDVFNRRVANERDVMLGQDALQPDPIALAVRRGMSAIGRVFRRDQQQVPGVALVPPVGNEPIRLPVRDIQDRAA